MKQLKMLFFIAMSLIAMVAHAETTAAEEAKITDLIRTLANLTDQADACGEHMNFYGKKALQGQVCIEFKSGFDKLWPSREALQEEIANYTNRLEKGEFKCENCRMTLQRAEELRITIIYYLDYMDYISEL